MSNLAPMLSQSKWAVKKRAYRAKLKGESAPSEPEPIRPNYLLGGLVSGPKGCVKKSLKVFNRTKNRRRAIGRGPSKVERNLVEQFVSDYKGTEILPAQIESLATLLQRKKATIEKMIAEARISLAETSQRYVDLHKNAVEQAFANGDPKSLEVAVRGAEWALSNISFGDQRIVDKPNTDSSGGIRVMVGLKFGGKNETSGYLPPENETNKT